MQSENVDLVISVDTQDKELLTKVFSFMKDNKIKFNAPYRGNPCIQGDNDIISYIHKGDPIIELVPKEHIESATGYMEECDEELDSIAQDIEKRIRSHMNIVSNTIGSPLSIQEVEPIMAEHLCLMTRSLNPDEISKLQDEGLWRTQFLTEDDHDFQLETTYDESNYNYMLCIHIGENWLKDSHRIIEMLMKRLGLNRL